MIRCHYELYGRVQGVGFRYRASYGARHLGLTGWVRNNSDGSVTMEVQGYPAQVDELLRLLCDDSYIEITKTDKKDVPVNPDERSFGVRY